MTATAEPSGQIAYFGYGSLVNRATLRTEIISAVPARLNGWRRHWRPRPDMPGFPAALLTVERADDHCCDGLLVFDNAENLAAVDVREARYNRVELQVGELTVRDGGQPNCAIYVYVADAALPPHRQPPMILQSYLDAVMQGFLVEHGDEGLQRFIAETHDFHIPILRDRDHPTYPRSVLLPDKEIMLFDALLADNGARYVD